MSDLEDWFVRAHQAIYVKGFWNRIKYAWLVLTGKIQVVVKILSYEEIYKEEPRS